ncbi:FeoB-associated Cys-rich membrane protein [Fusibacter tunisiensis]|jgi:hypothetical protein|uniref:FeoB-associated Cys-rich membrane protein n=1 Tax=Fusibacter tunisiensis TaxID=1008308 RepID=A0ABS2MNN8_9FIRM|nr:FeoB-associated Cys-rich membrane protein [Fusibacter tunisiensis]MBM7561023.1 hypothetical protein [Fusibacter tunisiensis]
MGTLVIGLIFAGIILLAGKRAFSDLKKGKCAGCSGCSDKKSTCQIKF